MLELGTGGQGKLLKSVPQALTNLTCWRHVPVNVSSLETCNQRCQTFVSIVHDCTELKNKYTNYTSSCGIFLTCRKMEQDHIIIHSHKCEYSSILSFVYNYSHSSLAYLSHGVCRWCRHDVVHPSPMFSLPTTSQVIIDASLLPPMGIYPTWQPQILDIKNQLNTILKCMQHTWIHIWNPKLYI